jgi:hypothetical protein
MPSTPSACGPLVLLILASMRSPFLPSYGALPALWLATLGAGIWRTAAWHRVPLPACLRALAST